MQVVLNAGPKPVHCRTAVRSCKPAEAKGGGPQPREPRGQGLSSPPWRTLSRGHRNQELTEFFRREFILPVKTRERRPPPNPQSFYFTKLATVSSFSALGNAWKSVRKHDQLLANITNQGCPSQGPGATSVGWKHPRDTAPPPPQCPREADPCGRRAISVLLSPSGQDSRTPLLFSF